MICLYYTSSLLHARQLNHLPTCSLFILTRKILISTFNTIIKSRNPFHQYSPERHRAYRSWQSKWWLSGCRSPRQIGWSRWLILSRKADLACRPAWSPARLHLLHTWQADMHMHGHMRTNMQRYTHTHTQRIAHIHVQKDKKITDKFIQGF